MKTLVFLSAVIAATVARLEAAQSPVPDSAPSKAPTLRTNSDPNQGASADDVNPVPGTFKTSRPLIRTLSNSFLVRDDSDCSPRIIDNPHMGLPFGAVLPLPAHCRQASPTASTKKTPIYFGAVRVDSPHAGLPFINPTPDSTASTTTLSPSISNSQTGTSSDSTFGSFLSDTLTDVPSKRETVSDLTADSFPASLTINSGDALFSSLPQSPFVTSMSIPYSFPTHSTQVFFPTTSPISHVPISAGAPAKTVSASPCNNENVSFLQSDPFGRWFTKTAGPKFFSKSSSSLFTTTSSQGRFLHSVPFNIATSSIPINTVSFGFPNSSPSTNPLPNIASTINKPHGHVINTPTSNVPITNPSSGLPINSAKVLLFSDNVPVGNVVNTPQGAVLVGGPTDFTIFPQQPSLDDINQVLAAHEAPPQLQK